MNHFDLALLVVACVLVIIGMVKGMVRILIGLGALIAAFAVAARFHGTIAERLDFISIPERPLLLLSYFLLFVGVMLLGGLIGYLMRKLLKAAMLGWADRVGGAAVGLLVATLVGALLILPLAAYSPNSDRLLRGSVLAPYVSAVSDMASPLIPERFSDLYREKMEDLRLYWRNRMLEESDLNV